MRPRKSASASGISRSKRWDWVWLVVLHGTYWQDYVEVHFVLAPLSGPCRRLKAVFGDSFYGHEGPPDWVRNTFGWIQQTVLRAVQAKGIVGFPIRWIVVRTFAWLFRHRRHTEYYKRNPERSEAMIYIAIINLMSCRLTQKQCI